MTKTKTDRRFTPEDGKCRFNLRNWSSSMGPQRTHRRTFLKQTAAAAVATLGLPYLVRSPALGNGQTAPASERITVGAIGMGAQGQYDMKVVMRDPGVQVVAICDVSEGGSGYPTWYGTDKGGRRYAKQAVEEYYAQKAPSGSYKGCDVYTDFRDLLARQDIDAVIIGTPYRLAINRSS